MHEVLLLLLLICRSVCGIWCARLEASVIRLGTSFIIRNVLCPHLLQYHSNKERPIVETASYLEQVLCLNVTPTKKSRYWKKMRQTWSKCQLRNVLCPRLPQCHSN